MIELRETIKRELTKHSDRVYYHKAPADKVYPYIVYDFPNSFMEGDQEIFNLDVDIWDNQDDTTPLETLATQVWRLFHRYHHIDENIQLSIYRENRLPPLDEKEQNIKRRKLIFQVRYFDRRI